MTEWGDLPSRWSIQVLVTDVDDCAGCALALGGKVCVPPFDARGVRDQTRALTCNFALVLTLVHP